MKILVMSDLHGQLPTITEEVDLVLICGDIVPLDFQSNVIDSALWLINTFKQWAENLKTQKVIFIAGNHDYIFESFNILKYFKEDNKVSYLLGNITIKINDKEYNILGSPYCKKFGTWAFMYNYAELESIYNELFKKDIDILITHDAPDLKNLGTILQKDSHYYGKECGNTLLASKILEYKPKYVFCGHIHSGNHNLSEIEGIKLANTSLLDENYKMNYKPLIIEI